MGVKRIDGLFPSLPILGLYALSVDRAPCIRWQGSVLPVSVWHTLLWIRYIMDQDVLVVYRRVAAHAAPVMHVVDVGDEPPLAARAWATG